MKKREIIALCFLVAGGAMQAFAFIGEENPILRGIGLTVLMFGIAVEIIGYAISNAGENPRKK